MTKREEYNLVFRTIKGSWTEPVVDVNFNDNVPHWEAEIAGILNYTGKSLAIFHIEEIENVLNGTWVGEDEDDLPEEYFETEEHLRFDLEDGFVYFNEGTRTDGLDTKIPLLDYKILLEEWLNFLNSHNTLPSYLQ